MIDRDLRSAGLKGTNNDLKAYAQRILDDHTLAIRKLTVNVWSAIRAPGSL